MTGLRVINLGLPKSGTTTLAHALGEAGLSVADYRVRPGQDPDHGKAFVAHLVYQGYFHEGDPLAHLGAFDAVTEMSFTRNGQSFWPQCDWGVIDAIRTRHPKTKFLASWRDPFQMSQSMLGWSDMGTDRLPRLNVPGLPAGYGETSAERVRWIEAHHGFLRQVFAGDPAFLEYDTAGSEAPAKIGAHIGRDLPWWGHLNANSAKYREDMV